MRWQIEYKTVAHYMIEGLVVPSLVRVVYNGVLCTVY